MGIRRILAPNEPELLPAFVNLLARHAAGSTDVGPLDRALAKALTTTKHSRKIADRLVNRFLSIPPAKRTRIWGPAAVIDRRAVDPARIKVLAEGLAGSGAFLASGATFRDDVGPAVIPPFNPRERFTLQYKGLFCREETNWDQASSSDEIYIITSVATIYRGQNIVRTEKHPVTSIEYGGIDSGEYRSGPVASCWEGPSMTLSLVAAVFERDRGDPDAYKAEIELAVTTALAVAGLVFGGIFTSAAAALIGELIALGLNSLLDTDDDLIETKYLVVTGEAMRLSASGPQLPYVEYRRGKEPIRTGVARHFFTEHRGAGATYLSFFSWDKSVSRLTK